MPGAAGLEEPVRFRDLGGLLALRAASVSAAQAGCARAAPKRSCVSFRPTQNLISFSHSHTSTQPSIYGSPPPSSRSRRSASFLGCPVRPAPGGGLCLGEPRRRFLPTSEGPARSRSRFCPSVCFQFENFPPSSLCLPGELITCGKRMGCIFWLL